MKPEDNQIDVIDEVFDGIYFYAQTGDRDIDAGLVSLINDAKTTLVTAIREATPAKKQYTGVRELDSFVDGYNDAVDQFATNLQSLGLPAQAKQ